MVRMSSEDLLNVAFKTVISQEDSSDCFSEAASRRKALILNYYGSLKLKCSPQDTECLINEELNRYGELIDSKDPGSINNYAECVTSILPSLPKGQQHKWKSSLNEYNFRKNLEPLPCSNNHNCKNAESLSDISQTVKQAFLNQNKTNVESTKNFIRIPQNVPVKSAKRNASPERCFFPPKISQPEQKTDENTSTNRNLQFFRTARDELQIQNAKKYGKNSNFNERQNQGPVKKSLGARKGGVFGKFQPPIRSNETNENENQNNINNENEIVDERLKNIDPAMIELIKNEIMYSGSSITWDDIAGLHLAKNTIQEIVVWPMLRPDIFTGLRRPPKGILLFGPPGTGKTLIGKCIASQSNSTFFSISASSLTSKWVGDGEKMVRTLFAVAKVYQPSVVFIDEIDSLLTQRSDSDHECSRRIKTEFLVQLDGAGTGDEDRILVIGATNRPQELDEAARRRLVKRLYIPLPDKEARKQIIQNLISTERHCLTESDIENLAKLTEGYSGADVKNLCQEASLGPIRSIAPTMIQSIDPMNVRPLNAKDFESALNRIKSSVSESDLNIYLAWDKQYGCGSGLS